MAAFTCCSCSHNRSRSHRSDLPATLFDFVLSSPCEQVRSSTVLPLRAHVSLFETLVQAHSKVQICLSLLTVDLCSCSVASSLSTLAVKLCSQRSFECACEAESALAAKAGEYSKPRPHSKLRCVHCQSFAIGPYECLLLFSWSHDCGDLTLCLLGLGWQVCL